MTAYEPVLERIAIGDLRPTQITVGFREVEEKRKHWREHLSRGGDFLGRHLIPTVIGPKGRPYIIDHHHLALALLKEGVEDVLITTVADLHTLAKSSFWTFLDTQKWCHTYDSDGERRDFAAIPTSLAKLTDDPYRSLAGELRRVGGFAKDLTPFSEFVWADFLRQRIGAKDLEKDFETALAKALQFAKSKEADYLPGWCGPASAG